jgi:hypothetical protein
MGGSNKPAGQQSEPTEEQAPLIKHPDVQTVFKLHTFDQVPEYLQDNCKSSLQMKTSTVARE